MSLERGDTFPFFNPTSPSTQPLHEEDIYNVTHSLSSGISRFQPGLSSDPHIILSQDEEPFPQITTQAFQPRATPAVQQKPVNRTLSQLPHNHSHSVITSLLRKDSTIPHAYQKRTEFANLLDALASECSEEEKTKHKQELVEMFQNSPPRDETPINTGVIEPVSVVPTSLVVFVGQANISESFDLPIFEVSVTRQRFVTAYSLREFIAIKLGDPKRAANLLKYQISKERKEKVLQKSFVRELTKDNIGQGTSEDWAVVNSILRNYGAIHKNQNRGKTCLYTVDYAQYLCSAIREDVSQAFRTIISSFPPSGAPTQPIIPPVLVLRPPPLNSQQLIQMDNSSEAVPLFASQGTTILPVMVPMHNLQEPQVHLVSDHLQNPLPAN
eukprot:TRINITY_DN35119_c0_g1_i1.p1 TRINITY_DN35119_c0_g1~~TRINITY_DN35119_c0_g1_i1.p1  ORF type:complete len:384 (+),score=51.29 TRINITY_DN35119_c0_g1_i1:56-1207(+)